MHVRDSLTAIAIWCTFVETCSRHGVDDERYLNWLFDLILAYGFDAQRDAVRLTPSCYVEIMHIALDQDASLDLASGAAA